MRILVVEDEQEVRELLARLLRHEGHEVVGELTTGEDAIEMFVSLAPDLTFMDNSLGEGITGLEALQRIFGILPQARIVICSSDSVEVQASLLGAVAFLRKPYDHDDVRAVLRRFV